MVLESIMKGRLQNSLNLGIQDILHQDTTTKEDLKKIEKMGRGIGWMFILLDNLVVLYIWESLETIKKKGLENRQIVEVIKMMEINMLANGMMI